MSARSLLTTAFVSVLGLSPAFAADTYKVDPVHSSVAFRIKHLQTATFTGRFNDVSGSFTVDEQNPAKNALDVVVKVDSVDTGNTGRDGHLKKSDFFNSKQFPTCTFKSKKFTKTGEGYDVVGDLTLHGVTKEISFKIDKIATVKAPVGGGYVGGFDVVAPIKRSDFGMSGAIPMLGDEVVLLVGIEGTRK